MKFSAETVCALSELLHEADHDKAQHVPRGPHGLTVAQLVDTKLAMRYELRPRPCSWPRGLMTAKMSQCLQDNGWILHTEFDLLIY